MLTWAAQHLLGLAIGAGITGMVAVILAIIGISTAAKARKRHRRRGGLESFEPSAEHDAVRQELADLQDQIVQLQRSLEDAEEALRRSVKTPQTLRFNAFGDTGSDLSFSVALVDDSKTGIVISSIYGREESRTYAKPIVNGESKYPLTEEELVVLTGKAGDHDTQGRRRRPVYTNS